MREMIISPYTSHNDYVNYKNYEHSRLKCKPVVQKSISGSRQYYNIIPLLYNYGDNKFDNVMIEGCEMEVYDGIRSHKIYNAKEREKYDIHARFDLSNPNHNQFLDMMKKFHDGCAVYLDWVKDIVKMHKFRKSDAEVTGFKYPVYTPRDWITGEILVGRDPSIFLKLVCNGFEQTLFTDESGKVLPWHQLENVEMRFIPMIHVEGISIVSGYASLRIAVASAVVTGLQPRNSITKQIATLSELKQRRPELSDMVKYQLAKLEVERQIKTQQPNKVMIGCPKESHDMVSYHNFKLNDLLSSNPDQRTVPGTGPSAKYPSYPQYYYLIPLMYRYMINNNTIVRDFLFEACELETNTGIRFYNDERPKYKILCKLDEHDPDQAVFTDVMTQIYNACSNIISSAKSVVKMSAFDKTKPEETGFSNPINYPRDLYTDEIRKDEQPSIYFKLINKGSIQTVFTDIDGKQIPWDLLKNVEMKFIPLIHVKNIYIGNTRAWLQMEIKSAIVTSVRQIQSTRSQ